MFISSPQPSPTGEGVKFGLVLRMGQVLNSFSLKGEGWDEGVNLKGELSSSGH